MSTSWLILSKLSLIASLTSNALCTTRRGKNYVWVPLLKFAQHTHTHTHINIYRHKYAHAHMHTILHACLHHYMHTFLHEFIHTCLYNDTHAHRAQARLLLQGRPLWPWLLPRHDDIHTCPYNDIHTHAHTGPKPGFFFKAGPSGLGYYPDTIIYTCPYNDIHTRVHRAQARPLLQGRPLWPWLLPRHDNIHTCSVNDTHTHTHMRARTCTGPKPGFFFKAGPSGLGYYPDTPLSSSQNAQASLAVSAGPSPVGGSAAGQGSASAAGGGSDEWCLCCFQNLAIHEVSKLNSFTLNLGVVIMWVAVLQDKAVRMPQVGAVMNGAYAAFKTFAAL